MNIESTEIINKLKILFCCKTNRELAQQLEVHESTIARWCKKGFYPSTTRIIKLLLEIIKEESYRK